MCGRFALARSAESLRRDFDLAACADLVPRYNIAPSTEIPVIRRSPEGTRVLHLLRWGLVPHWSQDPAMGARLINARAESVSEKPAFRGAFRQRRCLIPADGFYEWDHQGGSKRPYYFSDPGGAVLAFGGLWESWQGPEGLLRTTCILTTAANMRVTPIHDRMPLLLEPADWATWLAGNASEAQALLEPAAGEALQSWPVSLRVNRVQEEGVDLIAPRRD